MCKANSDLSTQIPGWDCCLGVDTYVLSYFVLFHCNLFKSLCRNVFLLWHYEVLNTSVDWCKKILWFNVSWRVMHLNFGPWKLSAENRGFQLCAERKKGAENGSQKHLRFYCAYGVFIIGHMTKNASKMQHGCIFNAFLLRFQCILMGRCIFGANMHQNVASRIFNTASKGAKNGRR